MNSATIIRVDGTVEELDHRPTLEEAQQIVDGYIELVHIPGRRTLVVNEEGRPRNLRFNAKASEIAGIVILGDTIVLEGWRTVG